MIHKLQVETKEPVVLLGTELVYRQVPYWCNGSFRSLTVSLMRERCNFPYDPPVKKQPVIVFLCGGSWLKMDPTVWMPEMSFYAKQGYAVASVQYSVSGDCAFPEQIMEIRQAIRFLRAHAEELRLDPERIAIMGESAGGHLAAITALTARNSAFDNGELPAYSSTVNCAVIYYAPTDFENSAKARVGANLNPIEKLLNRKGLESDPELCRTLDIRSYITSDAPPFLLAHGTGDTLVPVSHGDVLYEALTEKGIPTEYLRIEGAPHAGAEFFQTEIKERILAFLQKNL